MLRTLALFLAICCGTLLSYAQNTDQKIIKKSIPLSSSASNNSLVVRNIFGDVKVEGYNGNTIEMEATIKYNAKNVVDLKKAKEELKIETVTVGDFIFISLRTPCDKRNWHSMTQEELQSGTYYNDGNCHWQPRYKHQISYVVKVPKNLNVSASTINNGHVEISKINGEIKGVNVNGDVTFTSISGGSYGHTVNGDINVDYTQAPKNDCRHYTLNGTINMNIPKGFSADIAFKTFQGDFYTDVDDINPLAPELSKTKKGGKGTAFQVEQRDKLRVRKGGILLDFETFNGEVYLREK